MRYILSFKVPFTHYDITVERSWFFRFRWISFTPTSSVGERFAVDLGPLRLTLATYGYSPDHGWSQQEGPTAPSEGVEDPSGHQSGLQRISSANLPVYR